METYAGRSPARFGPVYAGLVSLSSLSESHRRYLRLLGIDEIPAGLEGLREIVRRHLSRVPFENISKLQLLAREGRGRFLSLEEFLDGIEYQDLGGTCHANNPFLLTLLHALGYEAALLGADMTRPNVHTCLRVRIDSAAYHVDAGYGGPFREPIRLDRLPWQFVEGPYRYVLDRKGGGDEYEMSVLCGPERVHGYVVHDAPRSREFFTPAMEESFQPGATFLNCLRICRIFEDHSVVLLNRSLSLHSGPHTGTTELRNAEEWASAFANRLRMPRCAWAEAVQILERNTGKPLIDARTAHAEP